MIVIVEKLTMAKIEKKIDFCTIRNKSRLQLYDIDCQRKYLWAIVFHIQEIS